MRGPALGGARRVLFLVDRSNLGEQVEKEFQGFRTPDDNRKFTELYNVQRLTSNTIGASAKVVITTIQRLYSMLKGEPDLDPELEEASLFEFAGAAMKEPLPVIYNRAGERQKRKATWSEKNPEGRWRAFSYDEIVARDKVSLDLFWLRDESLEDSANLPDPNILAQEIADDLRSALGQIEGILGDLEQRVTATDRP
jgi:hypothetical protein